MKIRNTQLPKWPRSHSDKHGICDHIDEHACYNSLKLKENTERHTGKYDQKKKCLSAHLGPFFLQSIGQLACNEKSSVNTAYEMFIFKKNFISV